MLNSTHIVLPEGVRKLDDKCFQNSDIEEIVIPVSVVEIGDYAFNGCKYLEKVIFEENSQLLRIGVFAFSECENLAHIDLPPFLELIQEGCFSQSGIEEISIPPRIKEIEKSVFSLCDQLKHVYF